MTVGVGELSATMIGMKVLVILELLRRKVQEGKRDLVHKADRQLLMLHDVPSIKSAIFMAGIACHCKWNLWFD